MYKAVSRPYRWREAAFYVLSTRKHKKRGKIPELCALVQLKITRCETYL